MEYINFFPDTFEDLQEDDEEFCIADECLCSECNGVFILPTDIEITSCPLCGSSFD
jgi:hypothetical protein